MPFGSFIPPPSFASLTVSGTVSTTTQSFAGAKSFASILGLAKIATGSLPAPGVGNEGFIVYDSTTQTFKYSNGTAWVSPSGGVTGSGSSGNVAFWNGASSLGSNSDLFWDNVTSALGVNITTPEAPLHAYSANPSDYYNNAIFVLKSDTSDPAGIILGAQTTGYPGKEGFFRFSDGVNGDDEIRYKARSNTESTFYIMDSPLGADSSQPKVAIGYDVANDFSALTEGSLIVKGSISSNTLTPTHQLEIDGDGYLTGPLGPGPYATGSLPSAATYEGFIVYDTTTNTIKFSDGSVWAELGSGSISGSGTNGQVTFWDGASSISSDTDLAWDNSSKKLTVGGGFVVGAEIGALVPANHLMQLVATSTVTPLMVTGGSGAIEIWKDSTPTQAVSIGMAVPGNAVGDDLIFSTYGGTWQERLRVLANGDVQLGGDHDILPSADNTGEIGTDALRWQRIRAVSVVTGASLIFDNNIRPTSDSTFHFRKTDNSTNVLSIDTTNSRLGINVSAPTKALDILGDVLVTGNLSSTQPMGLAKIATGSLPTPAPGNEGFIVYDDTTNTLKYSDGGAWVDAGGGGGGSVTGSGSAGAIPYWTSASNIGEDPTQLFWDATNNRLGIGTPTPTKSLDVSGGNIRVSGINDEASIILQRMETIGGSVNPAFKLGTIVSGGVNLPMIKFTVTDNTYTDKDCFIIESSGTVASVSDGARRSHYEAFLQTGDVDPVFRLNSSPYMTLEMGPGGAKVSTGGLVRVSNVVTVTCDVPHGLTTGSTFHLSNTEANFAAITGSPATVASYISPTVFTYADAGADATSTIDHYVSGTTDVHFKRSGAFTAQLALGGGAKATWYPDSYVLEPGIDLYVNNTGGTPLIWASAGYNRVGMGVAVPSAKLHVKGTAAAEVVSVIQSPTSPTNSIMEWWDPAGSAVARVWHTGQIESVAGGFKFPDATTQTTAALTALAAIGAVPNANGASISGTTLTLQPADASFGGVVTTAAQTFAGSKTFNAKPILNAVVLGLGQIATGSLPAAASHTGSIAYDSTTSTVKFSDGASWANISSGGSGVTTMAAIGAVPNANGATISGTTLNLQPADASFGGVVTTAAQTFAGSKTFNAKPILNAVVLGLGQIATGSLPTASSHTGSIAYDSTTSTVKFSDGASWATIGTGASTVAAIGAIPNANGASISGTTLTLQPASASFGGVLTTGTQTIVGVKTFQQSGADVMVVDSTDNTGNFGGIKVQNNAGSNGHPFIRLVHNTTEVGSLNGNTAAVFGMVNGVTLTAASGRGIGFRVANTSIASFTSAGSFAVDGTTFNVDATNNRVGIGTAGPSEALQVVGNVRFSGALMPNNLAGTSGQVLTSAGAGAVPTWTTPAAAGVTTMAAVGGSGSANGAAISGVTLTLQPASASDPGVVTTGTQTLQGDKTIGGTLAFKAGTGTGTPLAVGTLDVKTTAIFNSGTGETNFMSYTLPASSLVTTGRGVRWKAMGQFGNTADTKTVRIYFGASAYVTIPIAINTDGFWVADVLIFRTGSNAQLITAEVRVVDAGIQTNIYNTVVQNAATVTETSTIVMKVTGQASADAVLSQCLSHIEYV